MSRLPMPPATAPVPGSGHHGQARPHPARSALALCLAGLLVVGGPALAQAARKPARADPTVDPTLMQGGFLAGHPDLHFRQLGLQAYGKDKLEAAFRYFQRASLYGDKPSQGMVGEMLWLGRGVTQDKAQGYAWMDLAAERGYRTFLQMRERYWSELDEAQRARAVEQGRAIYARYGDEVAEPRLARVLRRASKSATGSRTGFVGSLKIYVPGLGGEQVIDGSTFYNPKYWDPVQYRAWQDAVWGPPRTGRVSVGEVQAVKPPELLAPPPATTEPAGRDDPR